MDSHHLDAHLLTPEKAVAICAILVSMIPTPSIGQRQMIWQHVASSRAIGEAEPSTALAQQNAGIGMYKAEHGQDMDPALFEKQKRLSELLFNNGKHDDALKAYKKLCTEGNASFEQELQATGSAPIFAESLASANLNYAKCLVRAGDPDNANQAAKMGITCLGHSNSAVPNNYCVQFKSPKSQTAENANYHFSKSNLYPIIIEEICWLNLTAGYTHIEQSLARKHEKDNIGVFMKSRMILVIGLNLCFGAMPPANAGPVESAKRFDFTNFPQYHQEHRCWLIGDPRTANKYPWLVELQLQLDVLLTTDKTGVFEIKSCVVECTDDGTINLVSPAPTANAKADAFIAKLGRLRQVNQQDKPQVVIRFKSDDLCTIQAIEKQRKRQGS